MTDPMRSVSDQPLNIEGTPLLGAETKEPKRLSLLQRIGKCISAAKRKFGFGSERYSVVTTSKSKFSPSSKPDFETLLASDSTRKLGIDRGKTVHIDSVIKGIETKVDILKHKQAELEKRSKGLENFEKTQLHLVPEERRNEANEKLEMAKDEISRLRGELDTLAEGVESEIRLAEDKFAGQAPEIIPKLINAREELKQMREKTES